MLQQLPRVTLRVRLDLGAARSREPWADAFVAIDLVRGAVKIDPWGGAEVRGASAFRYQLQIDPQRAAAAAPPERADILRRIAADANGGVIHADLFVDSTGRIRRVQLPAELQSGTPPTRNDGEMIAVTIDYADFGTAVRQRNGEERKAKHVSCRWIVLTEVFGARTTSRTIGQAFLVESA